MITQRPKTIICDIDGTLVKHVSPLETSKPTYKMELLPGTTETIAEWDIKGYNIILISGRREGARKETEKQLNEWNVKYHDLKLDKPFYDLFIDDKAINSEDFFKKEEVNT